MRTPDLTPREYDVLLGIAEGLDNHEIAAEIGISYSLAKAIVKCLLTIFLAKNRAHLVAMAYHRGVLTGVSQRAVFASVVR